MLPNLAIVGVTGAVGNELVKLLETHNIKFNKLKLFASNRSIGKKYTICNNEYYVEELKEDSLNDINYAIFSIGTEMSKKYIPYTKNTNCTVIDNSSAYRMVDGIPLVIPEINKHLLSRKETIISNPNCVVAIMLTALYPLYKINKIKQLNITTLQSASGAGLKGINDLLAQAASMVNNNKIEHSCVFGKQYIFNCFSHNSKIDSASLYNDEEIKIINETRKILNDSDILIDVTSIRVPTIRAHMISVNVEFENDINHVDVIESLLKEPSLHLCDDIDTNTFPEPIHCSNKEKIYVGRIRKRYEDHSNKHYSMLICGDQLLKGAALNAIQILEEFI